MRNAVLSVMLAAATLPAADFTKMQDVALGQVLEHPAAFMNAKVRFQAIFLGVADLYDAQSSHLTAERHLNFVVWRPDVRAWVAAERADPVHTFFCKKGTPLAAELVQLPRYQQIEIEANAVAYANGELRFEATSVVAVPKAGAWSDQAIQQVAQAEGFAKDGAVDLALEHYRAATAGDVPALGRARIQVEAGRMLIDAGRFADAASMLGSSISDLSRAAAGERSVALGLLGRAQVGSGAAGDAEASAQQAVALDPLNSEAWAVLGLALASLGRHDEARVACDRAIRLRPQDAEVRLALGTILDQQGAHDESIDALGKAIDLTPKDARIHLAKARALSNRGAKGGPNAGTDLLTAIKECDITLRLDAKQADAHAVAARAIEAAVLVGADLGRQPATRAAAIERWKSCLAMHPERADAKEAIARLRGDEINALAAKDDNAALIALLSGELSVTEQVALAWAQLGAGKADAFAATAAKLPADAATAEVRGWAAYLAGDFAPAQGLLAAATYTDPSVKGWRLGMALFKGGKLADAKPVLQGVGAFTTRASLVKGAAAEVQAALAAIAAAEAKAKAEADAKAAAEAAEAAKRAEQQALPPVEPAPAAAPAAEQAPAAEPLPKP